MMTSLRQYKSAQPHCERILNKIDQRSARLQERI